MKEGESLGENPSDAAASYIMHAALSRADETKMSPKHFKFPKERAGGGGGQRAGNDAARHM